MCGSVCMCTEPNWAEVFLYCGYIVSLVLSNDSKVSCFICFSYNDIAAQLIPAQDMLYCYSCIYERDDDFPDVECVTDPESAEQLWCPDTYVCHTRSVERGMSFQNSTECLRIYFRSSDLFQFLFSFLLVHPCGSKVKIKAFWNLGCIEASILLSWADNIPIIALILSLNNCIA